MQCHEIRISGLPFMGSKSDSKPMRAEKEAIHSGHFMVSYFEAEAQDDEYEVAVPVPDMKISDSNSPETSELEVFNVNKTNLTTPLGQLAIETSLTKLFQCMSLAYRWMNENDHIQKQKLTSPKWNRFKGIRLRWKDKIRLNNVIWRCWHMQFIKKENTLICQFASPLDEGTHNKPEAVVLEGKYWKRKLAAVTAEYKKWRMFYRNRIMGWTCKDSPVTDVFDWQAPRTETSQPGSMMMDEDYMELMSDTLFSTITSNQPFAFPDTREIARGANLADFIQPSLVQLQPNLEDFMDTFEPLHGLFLSKLPTVPEDCPVIDASCRPRQSFIDLDVGNQTSISQPSEQLNTLDCREIHQAAPNYESVVIYTEPLASKSIMPEEVKTSQFYQAKTKTMDFPPQVTVPGANQKFGTSEVCSPDKLGLLPVPHESFAGFESDNAQGSDRRNGFANQANIEEPTFRLPVSSPKIHQSYKVHQYHKMPPTFSTSHNRLQTGYDLASSTECLAPPDIPPAVEQSVPVLKNRHRTRSSSCLPPCKTRILPPSLPSANSDPALNVRSALLTQLLTNNQGIQSLQHTTDRFYSTHTVCKTSNQPILPSLLKTPQQNKILPKPTDGGLIIGSTSTPTQSVMNPIGVISSPDSPKDSPVQNVQSPGPLSQSPTSPLMFTTSVSPTKINKFDGGKPCSGVNEHRRVCHINAEQKRRYNIKNGFDVLYSLIPHLHQNPNIKLSKAAMLQKGAEYIRQLQAERLQAKEDMEGLKYQIETLSASISNCQSLLPPTGAPVSRHRSTKMKEMFDEFVRARTNENWKFWIFSILFEPLLQSFSCSVSTASYDDLYRSTLIWVEQHCSLVGLRPTVLNSLKNLCTTTEILSDPSKLPEEARAAVNRKRM